MVRQIDSSRHGRFSRYVPLILSLALILLLSGSEASMSNSSRFLRPVLEFFFPNANEATLLQYIVYTRKFAHVAEYSIFALAAARAFAGSSKALLRNWWFVAALTAVLLLAACDEFIQSFNPLRTGTPEDVAIDFAGGLLGILAFSILARILVYLKSPARKRAARVDPVDREH